VIGREIFLLPVIGQFLKPYLYGKYFLQKARDIKAKTTCLMLHTDFKITLLIYRLAGKPASHAAGVTYRYKEIQLRFIFRARIVFIFVSCLRNLCVTSKKRSFSIVNL